MSWRRRYAPRSQAAELTGGLVDPTLLGPLERAGYATSRMGVEPADLREAVRTAPARRPALPRGGPGWRELELADGWVRRPPGLRFDLGGSAKGHAADSAAALLREHESFAVDVGGDIAFGGTAGIPRIVVVEHPLDSRRDVRFPLVSGAIATSGLASRIWRTADGFAHHLIDPATGTPAWTGVVQATAIAPTAVHGGGAGEGGAAPRAGRRPAAPGGPRRRTDPRRRTCLPDRREGRPRPERGMSTDPTQHLFWLSSRAFGVVALVLVSLSVGVGLALAGRMSRRPGLPPSSSEPTSRSRWPA